MFNSNGYSLADIAAVTDPEKTGREDSWGNGYWWMIVLFMIWGWGFGGNGFGNGNNRGTTTREEISYGFDMNDLQNGVRGVQNSITSGVNDLQTALCQGFSNVSNEITHGTITDLQNNYALQTAITNGNTALMAQLSRMAADQAACCCDTQRQLERDFCDLNYNVATQAGETRRAIHDGARDIIENNNSGVRAILEFLTQDKIATLTAENQSLKFAASQQLQNNYLVNALREPCPVPAYIVPNPCCCGNGQGNLG